MRVLERRFLRGPNIYRMAPCLVAVLDLEGHRRVDLEDLAEGAALLRTLLPGGVTPVSANATGAACLLARLMFATQAWAGSTAAFCDTASPSPAAAGRYRMVCGYQHEAVAEAALGLVVELVTALLNHQSIALEAKLGALRALTDAHATAPARVAASHGSRIPVVAVTGTNGKTTTTQLIAHVLRACGVRTGTTTTQGIFIGGQCVQAGDCSGYWSARRVLTNPTVEVAALQTARGGILKRGLAFDRCDVGVVFMSAAITWGSTASRRCTSWHMSKAWWRDAPGLPRS